LQRAARRLERILVALQARGKPGGAARYDRAGRTRSEQRPAAGYASAIAERVSAAGARACLARGDGLDPLPTPAPTAHRDQRLPPAAATPRPRRPAARRLRAAAATAARSRAPLSRRRRARGPRHRLLPARELRRPGAGGRGPRSVEGRAGGGGEGDAEGGVTAAQETEVMRCTGAEQGG